jgi:hypothetical protein
VARAFRWCVWSNRFKRARKAFTSPYNSFKQGRLLGNMDKFRNTQSDTIIASEMACTKGNSSSVVDVGNTCTATEAGSTDAENHQGEGSPKISAMRGNLYCACQPGQMHLADWQRPTPRCYTVHSAGCRENTSKTITNFVVCDLLLCIRHVPPINESGRCSGMVDRMKRGLIMRHPKPKNTQDAEHVTSRPA